VLTVAWLLGTFVPEGPYAILSIAGEHGTAKSMFSGFLRSLTDPNVVPIRALPRNERDLAIMADNSHVLAFDNLSGFSPDLADALCRMSTGGGFGTKQLYEGREEETFKGKRPQIFNGIADLVTRGDLADRSLLLTLRPITAKDRKRETTMLAAFEKESGQLLGALFDGVSMGLRRMGEVQFDELPRMADFAFWIVACETAYWPEGTFENVYITNQTETVDKVIEADTVANALRLHVQRVIAGWLAAKELFKKRDASIFKIPPPAEQPMWEGSAEELLQLLAGFAGEKVTKGKYWPLTTSSFGKRLRRIAPAFRSIGVELDFDRDTDSARGRLIKITIVKPGHVGQE